MVNNRSASRTDTLTKMESQGSRCKIVVVGDTQCGKTALLHVFAKDCYPENYVPTVFENYTASFEIDKQRIELNMWDTSGSSYYDNVRPLAYPDSDAVLVCFDISRPETLDSVLKKWQGETQEFCPNAKVVLVGCKLDMRTDVGTLRELSKQRLIPITHEQIQGRRRLRAMHPPKPDPAKPHCLLNPEASRTNVSEETPSSWRLKSACRRMANTRSHYSVVREGNPSRPTPPLTRTTLGQLCAASWVSWSWPAVTQPVTETGPVVTP
uniref:Rho family GTPase 2 n=1 Tax=Oncorhynchus tshawytscha TaxID=74940 RepID=A0AAZ3Q9M4_ONCTS